jgi:hypothetical protein
VNNDVIVSVKTANGWNIALNGKTIWKKSFTQLWGQIYSPDGQSIASVAAPEFGQWTIAVDGHPWKRTFRDAVLSPVFSHNSRRVAAVVKDNNRWTIAVDGAPWEEAFDMVWTPVFSPNSEHVAAKAEKDGKFHLVIDGKKGIRAFDVLWDPVFSPDGEKLLIRCIENGKYYRRIVPVREV